MGIPESQLETWANQGATVTSQNTHESIRTALNSSDLAKKCSYNVYLQGSYKNFTNIYADSDVDVVVQLTSLYYYDINGLPPSEQAKYESDNNKSEYNIFQFRNDVLKVLTDYYGSSTVTNGNKSIKVAKGSNRLNADVVVCADYRHYTKYNGPNDQKYFDGMMFFTQNYTKIVNYPKQHFDNGALKNSSQKTNGWYKPVIRMFKNARTKLVTDGKISKDLAPSYYLECLLYNVPDSKFSKTYSESYANIVNWLSESTLDNFRCQHDLYGLFGGDQWSIGNARILVNNFVDLWNKW